MNREYIEEFLRRTGIGLKQLIRAKIISFFISLVVLILGLKFLEINHYFLIGLLISIIDIIPILGSGIVLIPWAIIVFIQSNPSLAIGLIVIYLITFILKQITEPIILGESIGINPIYTVLITIISMIIFTPAIGAILASLISLLLSVYLEMRKYKDK